METRSKVCLITKELSDRVFGLENPIGETIRMGELTFTVIGVFRDRVATFGLSDIQRETGIIPFPLMKYYTAVDGILIGLAIPVLVQPLLPGNLRVPISPLSVLIAFGVSCSTGLFFGYLPANNAARLQPIESLRYE